MKFLVTFSLALFLLSCSSNSEVKSPQTEAADVSLIDSIEVDSKKGATETLSDSALIKKWTWGDNIQPPRKSKVSNQSFDLGLLQRTWTFPGGSNPVFSYRGDSMIVYGERSYIYSVNYDSLRIFSQYDHPGDGITRGIIHKLTRDSLIIHWSTDDVNVYIPFEN